MSWTTTSSLGKAEDVYLFLASAREWRSEILWATGKCCNYTTARDGKPLAMLVLHDDAKGEYASVPARGLPTTKVAALHKSYTTGLRNLAVISMKNDWKTFTGYPVDSADHEMSCRLG